MGASVAWWFRIPFWQRVMGAFVLGALVGWLVGEPAGTWFQPLGRIKFNFNFDVSTNSNFNSKQAINLFRTEG